MLEKNDWGMADLGMDSLGIRVYGSAGISFQKFSQVAFWPILATSGLGTMQPQRSWANG